MAAARFKRRRSQPAAPPPGSSQPVDETASPKERRTKSAARKLFSNSTEFFRHCDADDEAIRRPMVFSFREYLERCARVPLRDGTYGPFTFAGRQPLEFIVDLIDAILRNTLRGKPVVLSPESRVLRGEDSPIDSGLKTQDSRLGFPPGVLKGATLTVGGGAQWGKTVLVLNLQAYLTFIEFVNFGYYTPDQELLAKIVDTKFRPDVIDQQPWMAGMISVGKSENASGKSVNRKHSYQASDGRRKAFGHFCGMQKPPTTISLDAAALDEVDDIPPRNMGYVDGRMTNSPLRLKLEIGTQRIAGAGQNARLKAGCFFVKMVPCPACGKEWNLEEEFPRIVRIRKPEVRSQNPDSPRTSGFCPAINAKGREGSQPAPGDGESPQAGQASSLPGAEGNAPSPGKEDACRAICAESGHDRNARYPGQ